MENVIKTLDRYYDAFKDQERDWGFFMGLTDYVNLLDEIPQLKGIIEKMMEGEQKMLQRVHEAEDLAIKELKALSKKMLAKAEKKKEASIQEAIATFKDFDSGKTHPEWWYSARLEHGIRAIIEAMVKEGYGALLKEILPKKADLNKLYSLFYDVCPAFSLRSALSYGLKEQRDTELWGNYRKLRTAAMTFQKGQERLEQMKKDGKDTSDVEELIKEKEIIRNDGEDNWLFSSSLFGHSDKKFSSSTDKNIKEFKRDKYQNYASRVHNYLVKELSRGSIFVVSTASDTQTEKGLNFDENKSRLFIRGKEIKIRKFSDQYHALRIIFANPKEVAQEWFFSDIAERVDPSNINEKRFYNAIYQVGLKAKAAGFADFFITTRQSAKINPQYLS